jgi:G3E family GTPase
MGVVVIEWSGIAEPFPLHSQRNWQFVDDVLVDAGQCLAGESQFKTLL